MMLLKAPTSFGLWLGLQAIMNTLQLIIFTLLVTLQAGHVRSDDQNRLTFQLEELVKIYDWYYDLENNRIRCRNAKTVYKPSFKLVAQSSTTW